MAAVIVCPALANDPSMASGTATTTTNSAPNRTTTTTTVTANPGRRVWVRKRTIHLKQKMKDDDKAQRTADKLDIMKKAVTPNVPCPDAVNFSENFVLPIP